MHTTELNTDELTITGLIFILLISLTIWFIQITEANKLYSTIKTDYQLAKTIVVEIDAENTSLHNSLISMNNYATELESIIYDPELAKLIQIRRDLRGYSIEERATGYGLSWTESSWEKYPDHKDKGFTQGPCGVTEYHIDYLKELGLTRYSYAACIEIYKLYKEQKGSRYEAIKAYKGVEKNTKLIDKTIDLRAKILKTLKEK